MTKTLLGPPGTGKTYTLIEKVKDAMFRGIDAQRIGYFAFTNRAADEARNRLKLDFDFGGLPFFRTLHSLAFNQLGLTRSRIFSKDTLGEFANWLGLELSVRNLHIDDEILSMGATEDDRTLFYIGLAAVRMMNRDEAMLHYEWDRPVGEINRVWDGLIKFKAARSLIDFNDMLYKFIAEGPFPRLDMIVIDESQDLSTLQWMAVARVMQHNPQAEVWFGGDDDQAIYEWAGADLQEFFRTPNPEILKQSFRVPAEIQVMANKVAKSIEHRTVKAWLPAKHTGQVIFAEMTDTWVHREVNKTLYLARNFHFLRPIAAWLEENGEDWGYLHQKDAIHQLSTIHGAKGAEAHTVVLDLSMTKRSFDELGTDAEKRVWYTAITRAEKILYIVEPYTRYSAEELILG
jgi:superfamily I DNA/RNA helicase